MAGEECEPWAVWFQGVCFPPAPCCAACWILVPLTRDWSCIPCQWKLWVLTTGSSGDAHGSPIRVHVFNNILDIPIGRPLSLKDKVLEQLDFLPPVYLSLKDIPTLWLSLPYYSLALTGCLIFLCSVSKHEQLCYAPGGKPAERLDFVLCDSHTTAAPYTSLA